MFKFFLVRLTAAFVLWCVMSGTMAVAQEPELQPNRVQNGVRYLSGGIDANFYWHNHQHSRYESPHSQPTQ